MPLLGRTPLLSLVLIAACTTEPPPPGFEGVGGEGASGGVTTAATTGATSTKATGATATKSATATTAAPASNTSASSGEACPDMGDEPNESEESAIDLGNITDCDDQGGAAVGVLAGPDDVDWFRYHATDETGCSVDPSRSLTAGFAIRLCKFIQCDNAEENDFECPSGTTPEESPGLRPGCCSAGGISFDLTCGGSSINSDNATVFIRLDNPDEYDCVPYMLSYHY